MNIASFVGGGLREFRHALRRLRHNPTFSITVVLTLALGIGATTAVFSVVNGVVLKPLPYPDSDKVVTVGHSALFAGVRGNEFPFSPQWLEVYGSNNRTFEEIGIIGGGQAAITGNGDPVQASTYLVSAGALRALAVQPALGRWFSNQDDRPGAPETVILSNAYWQQNLGADPGVVGTTITVDGRPREVIGVMPPRFNYVGEPMDLILPLQIDMANPSSDFAYRAVARLKPGMTVADANADVGRMLPLYIEKYVPGNRMEPLHLEPAVRPLKEDVVGNVDQILWLLLGSISILLLIACANVATLLLVRTETRGTELAVRTALGAGSGHLARGLIAESLTLGLVGGLAGVGLALGGVQILRAMGPTSLPRLNEITIDFSVLGFAAVVSILSGLLFGLVPTVKLLGSRFATNLSMLVQGGRWASAGKQQHRTQNMLVVIQLALALVMVIGSGLMIRTFQNLRSVDPGFTDPATIQTVQIATPNELFAAPDRAVQFQRQIYEQLAAIPGVTSAGYMDQLPMEGQLSSIVAAEDKSYASDETPPIRKIKFISPGLLQTLGTPLIAGRDFDWVELESQRNVAMVSESLARAEWNTVEGALGKRIAVGTDGSWQEIIGVVKDVYDDGLDKDSPPIVYWPARQHPFVAGNYLPSTISFVLRTERTGTVSLREDIRRALSAVAPDLPIARLRVLSQVYRASMARTSFSLVLIGIAGAMSLLISIVGIHGVLAYAVMQRQREVGIRLALGAAPGIVTRMFVNRGLILAGVGIALGVVAAAGLTRLMSSLLFGVAPLDALTFVAAAGFLVVAVLLASYLPARRAGAQEPARTLSGR
jgi:putative ABC transport system permease protein